jgi:hypothetical protein
LLAGRVKSGRPARRGGSPALARPATGSRRIVDGGPAGLAATVEPADGSEGLFLQFADGTLRGPHDDGPDTTGPQGVVGAGLEWLVTVTVTDRMTSNPAA